MIVGAVLCGGRSSRMGRDKALLPVEGVPMARRVADALRAGGCTRVLAIGGDAEALDALGLEPVADGWPGEGPLGGVLTALDAAPDAEACVVVACDMPSLTGETVAALVAALGATHREVAVGVSDVGAADPSTRRLESLCAAWRPSAAGRVRDAMEAGERRVRAVLADLGPEPVSVNRQDVANVNTPGDLGSSV